MKLRNIVMAACLLSGLMFASCDKDDDNDQVNGTDTDFMLKASISNTAEVDAANMAIAKATNAAVKAFAAHMIMEHSTAQTELKTLGTNVGFTVKDTLDPAHMAIKAALLTMAGREFDSAYMHVQVADHTATVANFQNELNNGQHTDVLNYASKYYPHIQSHLVRADSIANAFFPR